MPQEPFKVEIKLPEEYQTDFEVHNPDGSISHIHYDPNGLEKQREAAKRRRATNGREPA